MKKILFIILFVIIVLGLSGLFWYLFFGKKISTNINGVQPFVDENVFGNFFDTNNTGNNNFSINLNDQDNDSIENSIDQIIEIPALRQISMEPTAGFTFYEVDKIVSDPEIATSTNGDIKKIAKVVPEYVFRFMERATGHIFETTESNLTTQKISNTTIQKVNNAYFLSDPNKFLYDNLSVSGENLNTFIGELILSATSTEENTLETDSYSILASNLALSEDLTEFAYLNTDFDSTNIFLNNQNLNGEKEIFETPLREIILDWPNKNTFTLLTKPSNREAGYFYKLSRSGSLQKLLGNVPGLTAKLSPNEKNLIYSEMSGVSLITKIFDLEKDEVRRLSNFVLPEKCVYKNNQDNILICAVAQRLPVANYPDDWYKGVVSFEDNLVEINTNTGQQTDLYIFDKEKEGAFDIVDIKITKDDSFVLFKNKKDLTLWALDLEKINNLENFDSGDVDL